MIKNKFKVPKKKWNKWGKAARAMFNTMYYTMTHNKNLFEHPDAPEIEKAHWNTTAWNAAWIAADEVDWIEAYMEYTE